MKKILLVGGFALAGFPAIAAASAQIAGGQYGSMMGGWVRGASSTLSASDTQIIVEGKALYAQLQLSKLPAINLRATITNSSASILWTRSRGQDMRQWIRQCQR